MVTVTRLLKVTNKTLFQYLGSDVMVLYLQLVVRNWGILWKAITFLCGYLSLCGVVSSWCGVVSSLCLVVTSPCGLFIMWCGFVFMVCWLHFRYEALVFRLYSVLGTSQTGFKRGPSSCSSALSKIKKWREQATIHIVGPGSGEFVRKPLAGGGEFVNFSRSG